jgi:hypothetical protein
VSRWAPQSSKLVVGCTEQATVGSTPIHSRHDSFRKMEASIVRIWNKMKNSAGPFAIVFRTVLLLFLLIAATGCGMIRVVDEEPAPVVENDAIDAALESAPQTGTTECTPDCAAAGQCGTRDDGSTVILGHSVQPVTQGHDRLFPAGTTVFVTNVQPRIIQQFTGEQLTINFYQAQTADGSVSGWLAGWCFAPSQ